jgi:hypothetical protein
VIQRRGWRRASPSESARDRKVAEWQSGCAALQPNSTIYLGPMGPRMFVSVEDRRALVSEPCLEKVASAAGLSSLAMRSA